MDETWEDIVTSMSIDDLLMRIAKCAGLEIMLEFDAQWSKSRDGRKCIVTCHRSDTQEVLWYVPFF